MTIATTLNFSPTTPAAPSGQQLVVPQNDGGSPTANQSFYDPLMVGDSGSGGDAGNVPAPPSGSAAAGKFLKADATWEVPAGSSSDLSTPPATIIAPNGSTSYTLPSTPANPTASMYFVNGIKKVYGTFYSISGTTLTILGTPPTTGDSHEIYYS